MKKLTALLLALCIFLNGCSVRNDNPQSSVHERVSGAFQTVSDAENSATEMPGFFDSEFYSEVESVFESCDLTIENIQLQFLSKEYIEELDYNTRENIFFGELLSDLNESYGDKKFIFTLENGETVTREFEKYEDIIGDILLEIAVDAALILMEVTISIVTDGVVTPILLKTVSAISVKQLGKTLVKEAVKEISKKLAKGISKGVMTNNLKDSIAETMSVDFEEAVSDLIGNVAGTVVEKYLKL